MASAPMPPLADGADLPVEWISGKCGVKCSSARIERLAQQGMSGAEILRVFVSGEEEAERKDTLVIKIVKKSAKSAGLGLPREAVLYNNVAPALKPFVPRIHYSYGDMATGEKCVVMEDLSSALNAGYFYGPGNPNNWGKDLEGLCAGVTPVPTSAEVTEKSFLVAAVLHATYWRDGGLLREGSGWLRAADWLRGEGKESWEVSQKMVVDAWERGKGSAPYGEEVSGALSHSIGLISWESYRKRMNLDSQWTLVHGDFHPANILYHTDGKVTLVDWEMVGVGSGAQDLGQFVISHMDPAERRACERDLVKKYHDELLRLGVPGDQYSWEQCWDEYRLGGLGRWMWFLAYFAGMGEGMTAVSKFFHDQVLAFMRDHNVTLDELGQPRP
eukprot:Hpha_TRINITY_DN14949_c3_g5::TRINITY_DN14949_c3_g5_i1::g.144182::m.144182